MISPLSRIDRARKRSAALISATAEEGAVDSVVDDNCEAGPTSSSSFSATPANPMTMTFSPTATVSGARSLRRCSRRCRRRHGKVAVVSQPPFLAAATTRPAAVLLLSLLLLPSSIGRASAFQQQQQLGRTQQRWRRTGDRDRSRTSSRESAQPTRLLAATALRRQDDSNNEQPPAVKETDGDDRKNSGQWLPLITTRTRTASPSVSTATATTTKMGKENNPVVATANTFRATTTDNISTVNHSKDTEEEEQQQGRSGTTRGTSFREILSRAVPSHHSSFAASGAAPTADSVDPASTLAPSASASAVASAARRLLQLATTSTKKGTGLFAVTTSLGGREEEEILEDDERFFVGGDEDVDDGSSSSDTANRIGSETGPLPTTDFYSIEGDEYATSNSYPATGSDGGMLENNENHDDLASSAAGTTSVGVDSISSSGKASILDDVLRQALMSSSSIEEKREHEELEMRRPDSCGDDDDEAGEQEYAYAASYPSIDREKDPNVSANDLAGESLERTLEALLPLPSEIDATEASAAEQTETVSSFSSEPAELPLEKETEGSAIEEDSDREGALHLHNVAEEEFLRIDTAGCDRGYAIPPDPVPPQQRAPLDQLLQLEEDEELLVFESERRIRRQQLEQRDRQEQQQMRIEELECQISEMNCTFRATIEDLRAEIRRHDEEQRERQRQEDLERERERCVAEEKEAKLLRKLEDQQQQYRLLQQKVEETPSQGIPDEYPPHLQHTEHIEAVQKSTERIVAAIRSEIRSNDRYYRKVIDELRCTSSLTDLAVNRVQTKSEEGAMLQQMSSLLSPTINTTISLSESEQRSIKDEEMGHNAADVDASGSTRVLNSSADDLPRATNQKTPSTAANATSSSTVTSGMGYLNALSSNSTVTHSRTANIPSAHDQQRSTFTSYSGFNRKPSVPSGSFGGGLDYLCGLRSSRPVSDLEASKQPRLDSSTHDQQKLHSPPTVFTAEGDQGTPAAFGLDTRSPTGTKTVFQGGPSRDESASSAQQQALTMIAPAEQPDQTAVESRMIRTLTTKWVVQKFAKESVVPEERSEATSTTIPPQSRTTCTSSDDYIKTLGNAEVPKRVGSYSGFNSNPKAPATVVGDDGYLGALTNGCFAVESFATYAGLRIKPIAGTSTGNVDSYMSSLGTSKVGQTPSTVGDFSSAKSYSGFGSKPKIPEIRGDVTYLNGLSIGGNQASPSGDPMESLSDSVSLRDIAEHVVGAGDNVAEVPKPVDMTPLVAENENGCHNTIINGDNVASDYSSSRHGSDYLGSLGDDKESAAKPASYFGVHSKQRVVERDSGYLGGLDAGAIPMATSADSATSSGPSPNDVLDEHSTTVPYPPAQFQPPLPPPSPDSVSIAQETRNPYSVRGGNDSEPAIDEPRCLDHTEENGSVNYLSALDGSSGGIKRATYSCFGVKPFVSQSNTSFLNQRSGTPTSFSSSSTALSASISGSAPGCTHECTGDVMGFLGFGPAGTLSSSSDPELSDSDCDIDYVNVIKGNRTGFSSDLIPPPSTTKNGTLDALTPASAIRYRHGIYNPKAKKLDGSDRLINGFNPVSVLWRKDGGPSVGESKTKLPRVSAVTDSMLHDREAEFNKPLSKKSSVVLLGRRYVDRSARAAPLQPQLVRRAVIPPMEKPASDPVENDSRPRRHSQVVLKLEPPDDKKTAGGSTATEQHGVFRRVGLVRKFLSKQREERGPGK